ncbi:substrate-binding domain-containing protein [Aureimonas sp. AU40]|uniref:substrate-binding domain-containing protein n=1 Tax=Aureimonas sp. AU40 TaxID=1637747 RepID=UPI000785C68D|nr:substrate-binding domain-containing protein [Aureimonas sp. AU40]
MKLGLLVPQKGPSGLWAASAICCAELAVLELNERGGVLGQPVELVSIDAGASGASAAFAVEGAIGERGVQAIVGMFPSYARTPVARAIGRRVPFVYTPQFEGFERDKRIVTTGETARELLEPAIEWFKGHGGPKRFFLCGNDYIWPRASLAVARAMIGHSSVGSVVGERYLPLGDQSYHELLACIAASRANVVLPFFLGSEAIAFHRAFSEAGLTSRVLRFTPALDETILYGIGERATDNLYASSAYFGAVASRNNGAFLERYHRLHGESPPPANAFGQSCYEGVHCLGSLIEAANTLNAGAVSRELGRTRQHRTARGEDRDPIAGARQPIHFARVDGYDFTFLPAI